MPIYEYSCKDCGRVSEFIVSANSEKEGLVCSHCGSAMLDKIMSGKYSIVSNASSPTKGRTCCGRTERCESPPCSVNGECKR